MGARNLARPNPRGAELSARKIQELFSDFSESSKPQRKEPTMSTIRRSPLFGIAGGGLIAALALADGAAMAQSQAIPLPEQQVFPLPDDTLASRRLRQLDLAERELRETRDTHELCREVACAMPSEAAALTFKAGPDQPLRGRFILNVRSASGPGSRSAALWRDGGGDRACRARRHAQP
jgi:hypothetical protein